MLSGDLGGHGIGPLSIQHLWNFSSKALCTFQPQCGGLHSSEKGYYVASPLLKKMQKAQTYQGNY